LTQAVVTDKAQSIFEYLQKKGGEKAYRQSTLHAVFTDKAQSIFEYLQKKGGEKAYRQSTLHAILKKKPQPGTPSEK
jgi:tRNA 2-selenouridine synthase SelU